MTQRHFRDFFLFLSAEFVCISISLFSMSVYSSYDRRVFLNFTIMLKNPIRNVALFSGFLWLKSSMFV